MNRTNPRGVSAPLSLCPPFSRLAATVAGHGRRTSISKDRAMKIKNSIKALKMRHRENRVVRRRGRGYVINKTNPRFKARQG